VTRSFDSYKYSTDRNTVQSTI